jgi:hypothetical protein
MVACCFSLASDNNGRNFLSSDIFKIARSQEEKRKKRNLNLFLTMPLPSPPKKKEKKRERENELLKVVRRVANSGPLAEQWSSRTTVICLGLLSVLPDHLEDSFCMSRGGDDTQKQNWLR